MPRPPRLQQPLQALQPHPKLRLRPPAPRSAQLPRPTPVAAKAVGVPDRVAKVDRAARVVNKVARAASKAAKVASRVARVGRNKVGKAGRNKVAEKAGANKVAARVDSQA